MKGLGEQIRTLRKTRRLTLVDVSKKTGIDQSMLSRIENEDMTGTVESHLKIADALGVSLPELYKNTLNKLSQPKDAHFKRKVERFSHSGGAVAEILTTGIMQKKMLPIVLKIKPKGHTETEEFPMGAERFVYVVKGAVDLEVDGSTTRVKTYESLYFDASSPHHFKNAGKTEAWCLSVVTPTSL